MKMSTYPARSRQDPGGRRRRRRAAMCAAVVRGRNRRVARWVDDRKLIRWDLVANARLRPRVARRGSQGRL